MMVRNSAFCAGLLPATATMLACWAGFGGAQVPAASAGLNTSAEYIAGFVRHIRWPAESQLSAWRVCIAGDMPRTPERAYVGRIVRGKPFTVEYVQADSPLGNCQVLDLTATSVEIVERLLARVRGMPILAVGTGAAFCSAGGQICLHLGDSGARLRQRFEVNLSTLKESALEVSARLLTVGLVHGVGDD